MDRTACTEPQCLYKGDLYIYLTLYTTWYNIQKFYLLTTAYVSVFCVDLRTYSDYFPIRH